MDLHSRGAEPGIEPEPAVQQADALLSELRRTLPSYAAPFIAQNVQIKKGKKLSLLLYRFLSKSTFHNLFLFTQEISLVDMFEKKITRGLN
jgi:hypothetical protein